MVVGSGAGGGVIAAELAEAGRSVVVLEAGPFVDEPRCRPTSSTRSTGSISTTACRTTWDGAVSMLAGPAVGGGTIVNWMTSIAAPDAVRAEWARDHGLDGRRRRRVRRRLRGDRARARGHPVDRLPPKDDVHPARRGAARLGGGADAAQRGRTAATAALSVRLSRAAPSSPGCGSTSPTAAAAGARIVERARVERVLIEGGRAVGVEARSAAESTGDGRGARGHDRGSARAGDAAARRPGAAGRPRRRRAAHAGRPARLGPRPPGDRTPPAAPPGPGRRGDLRRAHRHVARHDAGGALAPVRRGRTAGATATPSSRRRATRA